MYSCSQYSNTGSQCFKFPRAFTILYNDVQSEWFIQLYDLIDYI